MGLKLLKDHTPELKRRLADLVKRKTLVGWDNTPHYSGMTMAGLAYLQAVGSSENKLPARPVLDIALMFTPLNKSPLKQDLKKYFSRIKAKPPIRANTLTKRLGTFYQERIQGMMGDPMWLKSNADSTQKMKLEAGISPKNSPLVWEGDLRANVSVWINSRKVT